MQITRRTARHACEPTGLQLIEHGDHHHASRTRRRHANDFVAIEAATQRRTLHGGIARQIVLGDEAVVRTHLRGDGVGNPSRVERTRATVRNRLQRARQLRELERVATLPL